MEKLPIIEMAELNDHIIGSDNFQDVFTITDLDAGVSNQELCHEGYTSPIRLNALFMILVQQGTTEVSLDYVPYTLGANSFLIIMPTHIFQVAKTSSDFKGILLAVDKSFLEDCNPAKRSPSMMNYMQLRKNPCTTFNQNDSLHIADCFNALREKIRLRTHSFHKEVMQNAFVGFLLEIANIMVEKKDVMHRTTLSRKEEILNMFLQLLFEHVKEHHVVTFYADKLFITPQYLSLVLKELTGKSANKWIDDALVVEAKILLKTPQITVQQVADLLNFSDQSTFGKFFKKHIGMSPMEYRKSS
ncbi:helix-turn-helix transcriptional regulator [Parabacteroides sp. PF5-9]|uniref:helix-turn-helix domain-containing protein n=1 Tax=Parabacteroides sp. PF5-9 TaxID=1742404 RepID=UPI002475FA65|nr:helix-turn-helix transcriptional regulator [Parabacteroides sp. PF5-9]MDH6356978.1 AraC family transcriptional activator of pobA [Parabacteroides sp. PF5-9]